MQKKASSTPIAGVASPQRRHWPKSHAAPSCGWRPRAWASWGAAWRMRWSVIALCTSASYNSPHPAASCVHRWTPHRTRRLALTRAHPPLSLRAPRMTPHGPVDHALRHSIEKQSSRGRRAQQHEQQLQQQPFRSCWTMVAAAGGATNPRTTRTPALSPGARLLNPNPNPNSPLTLARWCDATRRSSSYTLGRFRLLVGSQKVTIRPFSST